MALVARCGEVSARARSLGEEGNKRKKHQRRPFLRPGSVRGHNLITDCGLVTVFSGLLFQRVPHGVWGVGATIWHCNQVNNSAWVHTYANRLQRRSATQLIKDIDAVDFYVIKSQGLCLFCFVFTPAENSFMEGVVTAQAGQCVLWAGSCRPSSALFHLDFSLHIGASLDIWQFLSILFRDSVLIWSQQGIYCRRERAAESQPWPVLGLEDAQVSIGAHWFFMLSVMFKSLLVSKLSLRTNSVQMLEAVVLLAVVSVLSASLEKDAEEAVCSHSPSRAESCWPWRGAASLRVRVRRLSHGSACATAAPHRARCSFPSSHVPRNYGHYIVRSGIGHYLNSIPAPHRWASGRTASFSGGVSHS